MAPRFELIAGATPPRITGLAHAAPAALWAPVSTILLQSFRPSALLAWYVAKAHPRPEVFSTLPPMASSDTRVAPLMVAGVMKSLTLATTSDRTVRQLQAQIAAQRRLLHDVSHELRLHRWRACRRPSVFGRQSPDKQDAMLERIERESARL